MLTGLRDLLRYTRATAIVSDIMKIRANDIGLGDIAIVEMPNGEQSLAQVIQLEGDDVSLQVFGGGKGLSTQTTVRFFGHPTQVIYSPNILGRVFRGDGTPIDGGPDLSGDRQVDIGGPSVNPVTRVVPTKMIRTNVPMIDVFNGLVDRQLCEVPVGFKWFVPGLFDGSCCFGSEESAGASFLRHDGSVWTTDKDGPIMNLLAAEITAHTDKDPGEHYRDLTAQFGAPYYTRLDAPATLEQKARLEQLSPDAVKASTLAGEPITAKLTRAPGNSAPIGGLKVVATNGWFTARPSGTEHIYKIYAENFKDQTHLDAIVAEAQHIVDNALASS